LYKNISIKKEWIIKRNKSTAYNERNYILKEEDEMNETIRIIYKVFAGSTAAYATYKLLEDKTMEVAIEGDNVPEAFILGAGQMSISLAVGAIVGSVLGNKLL